MCRLLQSPLIDQIVSYYQTGGNGLNGYLGTFGTDTIKLPGALNASLSWTGLFACFDDTFECPGGPTEDDCKNQYTGCPAPTASQESGNCPYGDGLEAGERHTTTCGGAYVRMRTVW